MELESALCGEARKGPELQAALSAVGTPAALRCMASCLASHLMKADRFRTRAPVSATFRSTLAAAASPSSASWPRAHASADWPSCASRRASSADTGATAGSGGGPGEGCIPSRGGPGGFRV